MCIHSGLKSGSDSNSLKVMLYKKTKGQSELNVQILRKVSDLVDRRMGKGLRGKEGVAA